MFKHIIKNSFLKLLTNIEYGSLQLVTPDGRTHYFQGSRPGPDAHFHVHAWNVLTNMLFKGDIGLAEDYRDGRWATRNLSDLALFSMQNAERLGRFFSGSGFFMMMERLSYKMRSNTLKGSKRNIHEHYDLGNEFYSLWLDSTMTYSSGIFHDKKESLEQAQYNKYDRILDRLGTAPGDILEVGCGWGGFADRAVQQKGHRLKGITLSTEQKSYADQRLKGLPANIALEDYRHQKGKYDYIVSIEMFEAVGEKYWKSYFRQLASLLKRNGKAVVQTITIRDDHFETYRQRGDAIRSFIFPGGMLPSKQRFYEEANRAGLKVTDRHDFGNDYAHTLKIWLQNFDNVKVQLPFLGFDDAFVRLWRFYLAGCISGFETGFTDVMQVELQHA